MAEKPRILLLGATGYIGGSILAELIQRNPIDVPDYTISALVRKPYQASILADAGVKPLIFRDLDDFAVIRDAARDHDIVVAAASARHAECARACLEGLGERQKAIGRVTHYVHTSGTSMLGDWPVTGDRVDPDTIYSDVDDDIYEIERTFPDAHSPVRTVNQLVIEQGEKEGVKTYIIPPPLIFGPGTGSFTLGFGQIHMLVQLALQKKQAVTVGSGSGIWNRVHIRDLSNLYATLVQAIIEEKPDLPTGKMGYYFAENGFQSWKTIAERIAIVGKENGALETGDLGEVSLQEVADLQFHGSLRHAESVLASNSRTKADRARQVIGWTPHFGEADFLAEIDEVVVSMAAQ